MSQQISPLYVSGAYAGTITLENVTIDAFNRHALFVGGGTAVIDGCSVPKMFATVAIPMAKTGFMVTGLMSFVNNWNELLVALVFISKDELKTLPLALSKFVGPYHTNYTQMFAAIMIAVIPTIIVYVLFANQIVDGLTAGAVKG